MFITTTMVLGRPPDLKGQVLLPLEKKNPQFGVIGLSDHLVAKLSENPLNLATSIKFSDPDSYDGGWS